MLKETHKLRLQKVAERKEVAEAAVLATKALRGQVPRLYQRAELEAALDDSTLQVVSHCPNCGRLYAKSRKIAFDAHVAQCVKAPVSVKSPCRRRSVRERCGGVLRRAGHGARAGGGGAGGGAG
mmetsp:Transcript_28107/g.69218  ORF Transcript_28107/g.69218 Transcript_28107/m.69218 type:complete len:124 (+) Transcript_28107:226-597(+)